MAVSKVDAANQIENQLPQANIANNVDYRNLIINGDFKVAQRSTSVTGITTGGYHTVDRFSTQISSLGTWTQSRSTDVPSGEGFEYSLKMDCTVADSSPAAGDYLIIDQRIEGHNLQYLNFGNSSAQKLTLSFWVKSAKTGTYIVWFFLADSSRSLSKSYTINTADTWEKKTITIDGDTVNTINDDSGIGLRVNFYLGAGTDSTSGTLPSTWESDTQANRAVGQVNLADSTSNDWYLCGVQLESGSVSSSFEDIPFSLSAERCLRYYYDTAGNLNTGVNFDTWTGYVQVDQSYYHTIYFPTLMRGTPTATATRTNSSNINTSSGITLDGASNRKCEFYAVGSANNRGYFRFNAKIDAEL